MSARLPNVPDDFDAPPPADDLFYGTPGVLDDEAVDREAFNDVTAPERPDRWTITNMALAEWAMAKLGEAEAQITMLTEQRNTQMERAQDWWARTVKAPQRQAAFFRGHLAEYALQVRADTRDRTKTLLLPNGEVPTRKSATPEVVISDDAALIAWARKNAEAIVKVTYKVNVTDLRKIATAKDGKAVTADGELIPGAAVSEPDGTPTCNPANIVIY